MADLSSPRTARDSTNEERRKRMLSMLKIGNDRYTRLESHPRLRSRHSSGDSVDNASRHRRTTDERYQDDGHLGSLRSPLRAETLERVSRRRSARHSDHSQLSTSERRHRGGNYSQTAEHSASNMWQLDSLSDFPTLEGCPTNRNWGTEMELVEQQERTATWHKSQLYTQENHSKSADVAGGGRRRYTKDELSTDEVKFILARRQKQIDYGKNTACYAKYCNDVPRWKRSKAHPSTPNKQLNYSRRGWDMLIRIWRKKLHHWDPESDSAVDPVADTSAKSSKEDTEFAEDAECDVILAADEDEL